MASITTRKPRKEQKEYEEILNEIPSDYTTILEESNNHTEDSLNISRIPSSTQVKFDQDPMKRVTLDLIYLEMREIRSDLSSKIDSVKEDIFLRIQTENKALKKEISDLKSELELKSGLIDELRQELDILAESKTDDDQFVEVERDTAELQQYIRRNNIEIAGIPDSVKQNNLEEQVIKIAKAVNVEISSNDIEACHRLNASRYQKGPKRTIVRFVNRKHAEKLLKRAKQFGTHKVLEKANLSNKIFINNNLCSYYRFLWGKVKALYERHVIDSFWVFNGVINLRFADNKGETMKVTHINELSITQ